VSTYAEEVVLLSVDIAVIRALKDGALSSRGGGTIGGRGKRIQTINTIPIDSSYI
jgi:hypothetical protein